MYIFQNIFQRPVYMHVKCIIQRSVDVKQSFNPSICNMQPYVQNFYNKGRYVPYQPLV